MLGSWCNYYHFSDLGGGGGGQAAFLLLNE